MVKDQYHGQSCQDEFGNSIGETSGYMSYIPKADANAGTWHSGNCAADNAFVCCSPQCPNGTPTTVDMPRKVVANAGIDTSTIKASTAVTDGDGRPYWDGGKSEGALAMADCHAHMGGDFGSYNSIIIQPVRAAATC